MAVLHLSQDIQRQAIDRLGYSGELGSYCMQKIVCKSQLCMVANYRKLTNAMAQMEDHV